MQLALCQICGSFVLFALLRVKQGTEVNRSACGSVEKLVFGPGLYCKNPGASGYWRFRAKVIQAPERGKKWMPCFCLLRFSVRIA